LGRRVVDGSWLEPSEAGGDLRIAGLQRGEESSLVRVQPNVIALWDAPDVVARADPLPGTEQLERDQPVVKSSAIVDTGIPNCVEPVVAVDEHERSISHK
jgi:hypothetical protein